MKRTIVFTILFLLPVLYAGAYTPHNLLSSGKAPFPKLVMRMQHLLSPEMHSSMNKAGDKKEVIEFYEQNWDDAQKKFTDTVLKDIIYRDPKGTPTKIVELDYSGTTSSRTIVTGLTKTMVRNMFINGVNINWMPSVVVRQEMNGTKWVSTEIDSLGFDKNNVANSFKQFRFKNGSWAPSFTLKPLLNNSGGRIGYEEDDWANGNWSIFRMKTDTAYNTSGKITEAKKYIDTGTGKWILVGYETYTLNAKGEPLTAARHETPDGKTFFTSDSFSNLDWFFYDTRQPSFIEEVNNPANTVLFIGGNMLKSSESYTYNFTYDTLIANNKVINLYTSDSLVYDQTRMIWNGVEWENSKRLVSTFYPDKDMHNDSQQTWNGAQWFTLTIDSNVNTYDADNYLLTRINKSQTAGVNTPNFRDTYVYNTYAGIEPADGLDNQQVRIFPNPANDLINIRLDAKNSNTIKTRILSMEGRILQESSGSGEQIQLNISGLAKGMYLLQISSSNSLTTNTFIKL